MQLIPSLPVLSTVSPAWRWQGVAFALLVALLPGILLSPLFIDQGLYAAVAMAMLRQGELPYVAGWDVKGPLTYFLVAGSFFLFGVKAAALRGLDLIFLALGYSGLRKLDQNTSIGAISFVLILGVCGLNVVVLGQPDLWATFLCLAMLASLRADHKAAPLLAGVLLGLAVQLKESYALFGVCAFIAYAAPVRLTALAHFALGVIAPLVIVVLVYLQQGALSVIWYDHWLYLLETHLQTGLHSGRSALLIVPIWPETLSGLLRFCFTLGLDALLVASVPGFLAWRQRDPRFALLLLVFFLMAIVSLVVQQRFLTPHYLPVMAAASTLVAPLISDYWRLWPTKGLVALILLRVPMLVVGGGAAFPEAWSYALGRLEAPVFTALHGHQTARAPFCITCSADAAGTISALSQPEQTVLIWGFDVLPAVMAQRGLENRLTHSYPLVATAGERQQRYRAELMARLEQHPPALVLVQSDDMAKLDLNEAMSSRDALATFPQLRLWLSTQCRFLRQNASYDIYVCGSDAAL